MIKIAIALGVLVTATLLMKKQGMSYRQSILKTIYPAIMWSGKAAGKKQMQVNNENKTPIVPFYNLTTKDINGKDFNFSSLGGSTSSGCSSLLIEINSNTAIIIKITNKTQRTVVFIIDIIILFLSII